MAEARSCGCGRPDVFDSGFGTVCLGCGLNLEEGASEIETSMSPNTDVSEDDAIDKREGTLDIVSYYTEPPVTHLGIPELSEDECSEIADEESTSFFVHKPLQSPWHIRLIRLLPSSQYDDEIHCRIVHAPLYDCELEYEALSYTWGNLEETQAIRCNSSRRRMNVTRNCAHALRDLRKSSEDRILWIDAICINQADISERNHQVAWMSEIYARAKKVFIHLGPSDCAEDLFEVLKGRGTISSLTQGKELQRKVECLLSMPWFRRVWVVQEVAVAREALIVFKQGWLDWNDISIAQLQKMGLGAFDDNGNTPPALTLTKLGGKPLKDLASLFRVARTCDSTDPRDRIYALIGLLSNADELGLFVDYEKTTEQLFAEVTILAITTYNHLDVLSEKRFTPYLSPPPSASASTWVPDMRVSPLSSSLAHWRGKRKLAFSESPVAIPTCLDFTNLERYSLKLRVLPFDIISQRLSGFVRHESHEKYKVFLYRNGTILQEDLDLKDFVKEAGLIQDGDSQLDDKVKAFSVGRKFMKTSRSFAICAAPVAVEDRVFAIHGATVPFVLRRDHNTGYYKFLGECYVHGFGNPSSGDNYTQLLGMYARDFVKVPAGGNLEDLNSSKSRVGPASGTGSEDMEGGAEASIPWIEITLT